MQTTDPAGDGPRSSEGLGPIAELVACLRDNSGRPRYCRTMNRDSLFRKGCCET